MQAIQAMQAKLSQAKLSRKYSIGYRRQSKQAGRHAAKQPVQATHSSRSVMATGDAGEAQSGEAQYA
jgi:hypothetical protein